MNDTYGKTHWFVPDCFIPTQSEGTQESHEAICILNCNEKTAQLMITIYFEDRDPIEGVTYDVAGRRTKHIRTGWLKKDDIEVIPKGVPYAMEIKSQEPIVIQYSRLDSSQKELALMTTMGYTS
ncbi:sensory rhodopsin transducer [Salipaludibacillus sp. HK11]|uniref:sensory rhodopsin transducer n=1 Tax=Salipaludibacillus sp. HK11 TaxID=3394320 RepID=UPI0039FDB53E